jgi:hypothetical protein
MKPFLTLGALFLLAIGSHAIAADLTKSKKDFSITYESSKKLVENFYSELYSSGKGGLFLRSVDISRGCSAETTCPDGSTRSCSVSGQGSCAGGDGFVVCQPVLVNDDGTIEGGKIHEVNC